MSFEKISTPQEKKDVPKITNEEYLLRFGGDKENFKEWMESKGIEADENGHALIEIDGKVEKVDVTNDIGKIIEIDEEDSEN
ncbi:MAG: hypothetical protein PHU82_02010 [Candidatus Pacebacteria bacterium]|jgi:hypothetical protein|nr:hypothetical protein [Candidatus Paceibacterota bacterium]MDD4994701.1 hypothetical protein [Candidatus Paceibacterota bacterium]MDD5535317.1 hypothetical protein [Candidatus Paceibacterota bacterium]